MGIDIEAYRARIGSFGRGGCFNFQSSIFQNTHSSFYIVRALASINLASYTIRVVSFISLLLLLSGIEPNPGPLNKDADKRNLDAASEVEKYFSGRRYSNRKDSTEKKPASQEQEWAREFQEKLKNLSGNRLKDLLNKDNPLNKTENLAAKYSTSDGPKSTASEADVLNPQTQDFRLFAEIERRGVTTRIRDDVPNRQTNPSGHTLNVDNKNKLELQSGTRSSNDPIQNTVSSDTGMEALINPSPMRSKSDSQYEAGVYEGDTNSRTRYRHERDQYADHKLKNEPSFILGKEPKMSTDRLSTPWINPSSERSRSDSQYETGNYEWNTSSGTGHQYKHDQYTDHKSKNEPYFILGKVEKRSTDRPNTRKVLFPWFYLFCSNKKRIKIYRK